MQTQSPRYRRAPWIAALLILLIPAVVFASPESYRQERDSDQQERGSEGRAKKIVIRGDHIQIDDETVLEIDDQDVQRSVEEALEAAEEALREMDEACCGYEKVFWSNKVQIGEDLYIGPDELVNGDAVVVFGDAQIEGKVTGDLVSVFGNVELGEGAIVNGEVVAVLGNVDRADGARVRGQILNMGPGIFAKGMCGHVPGVCSWAAMCGVMLGGPILILVLSLIIAVIFRDGNDRICRAVRLDVLKCWLIGFLIEVGLFVVSVVLAITIIGIPLVILLGLLVWVASLWGFAGVSLRLGRGITGDTEGTRSRAGMVLLGGIIIQGVAIVSRLLGLGGLFLPMAGVAILGGIISWLAFTIGLGAVWVTRFGTREAQGPLPAQVQPAAATP